jgi:heparan-alpha-glucosaminide N-acetyltransferase
MSPETLADTAPVTATPTNSTPPIPARAQRIASIDALRGFVMFMMIFVNDLAGAPKRLVPDWMVHFSDRHRGGSGMTFVDLVFPGFLFIVGMSIPFALGSRLSKGEPVWKTFVHILIRTVSLLALGILMVHESPDSKNLGWPGTLWWALMMTSAIFAFCSITPPGKGASPQRERVFHIITMVFRGVGILALVYLALVFVGRKNQHILTLYPFSISPSWYGILGLIGWAYLAAAVVYLAFRTNRTALLGCMALMTSFYAADRNGFFENFWPNHIVDFGGTLGSQAGITVAGLLLGSVLVTPDTRTHGTRIKFALWFVVGFAFAAMLTKGLYGISKNEATPSWCLWASAVTAALWILFYLWADVRPQSGIAKTARPLAVAGQNVLLAYLLSEMMGAVLDLIHLGDWYGDLAEHTLAGAIARSAGCGVVLLAITAGLNRVGFRLKL